MPEYCKTLADLSERLGVSHVTLHVMRKAGLVLPLKGHNGYNLEEFKRRVEEFTSKREADKSKAISADTRERKLQLECEKLVVNIKIDDERLKQAEIETAQRRAGVVTIEDHRATLDIIREMFLTGLDQIVESVSTKARSAKVRDMLQTAVDSLRRRLSERLDK